MSHIHVSSAHKDLVFCTPLPTAERMRLNCLHTSRVHGRACVSIVCACVSRTFVVGFHPGDLDEDYRE